MTAHAASCTHALRIHLAVEFDYLPAPGRSDTFSRCVYLIDRNSMLKGLQPVVRFPCILVAPAL